MVSVIARRARAHSWEPLHYEKWEVLVSQAVNFLARKWYININNKHHNVGGPSSDIPVKPNLALQTTTKEIFLTSSYKRDGNSES